LLSNKIKSEYFIFESKIDGLQSIEKDIIWNEKWVTEGQGDIATGPIEV